MVACGVMEEVMKRKLALAKGSSNWIKPMRFISLLALIMAHTATILPAEAHTPGAVLSGLGAAKIGS